MISMDPPPGYESQDRMYQGNRVFITFPAFHGAYLVSFLFNALPFGTTMIVPLAGAIPSGEGLVAGLQKTAADVAIVVPSIVQDLGQNPRLLDYCSQHLKAILYCGGDLPQSIGDIVASKVKLVNQFGATELGLTPNLLSSQGRHSADWKYVHFHPELGLEMRHVADDTFELYAVRDEKLKSTQPTFTLFPHLQEYASRDLFVRHPSPSKRDMWRWNARADDIIVFLNGEKTNPVSMEQHIVSSIVQVTAALVFGAQRFQAGLLVELATKRKALSAAERATFVETIWPTVSEANRHAPSHARVTKSHILFVSPQKPMMRAGKGTIQRAGTLKAYQQEIDALYKDADEMLDESASPTLALHSEANQEWLSHYIKELIMSITGWPEFPESEDIFALGMDSLHALILVRNLRQPLKIPDLAPSTLYTNPSVTALSRALITLRNEDRASQSSAHQGHLSRRTALLQEYRGKIDQLQPPPATADGFSPDVVVLTGSTGALGSHILKALLEDLTVRHIYCLNRAVNGLSLQMSRNRERQVSGELPSDRITFCTCDLSKPDLALQAEVYNALTASSVLVIHNAWPVNFNLSIDSFRPQLDSIVNLAALISKSQPPSRLFFVSSISALMSPGLSLSTIPEQIVHMGSAIHPNGYAESKYLSELLIHHACEYLSIDCSIARVGQLTGAARGHGGWNRAEWFPSLVLSSAHVGALPDSLGPSFSDMRWIPLDLAAGIIVEIATLKPQNGYSVSAKSGRPAARQPQIYHLVNPHPIAWSSIRLRVADTISRLTSSKLEIVDPRIWMAKVRKNLEVRVLDRAAPKQQDTEMALQSNPAAKILDFYQQIMQPANGAVVGWEIKETLRASKCLRDLPSIQEAWMDKWIEEWLRPSQLESS
ncbi:MAG: hypothetical protein LQ346_006125 [Caloplaca aetnensis]|nr:MAG: hypothetical protein LQ346_006125 [Caloplaca aetnensis]